MRSAPAQVDIDGTRKFYRHESLGIRAFVAARRLLAPLDAIVRQVPAQGAVLDLGCGHGVFCLALAAASPDRWIVGVDPSPQKIVVAKRVGASFPNLRFQQGLIDSVAHERFDVIIVLDVLYLMPPPKKLELLQGCRRMLAAGGVLLLKTNDTHPAWKYHVARAQERLMTGMGLTMGSGKLHFMSSGENADLLRRAGFSVETVHLRHWSPYPHVLFIAR
ncbi:MAG: class I SAM-dependent methyltransferase [Alphaproteobacteria bacterium]|nr:class I SAM-dependent methyltransferase [Alphaproteobacteria bacterium]